MTILITGGTGMVGNAMKEILPNAVFIGSEDFDLTDKAESAEMFSFYKPRHVIHLAAKVGGVKANTDYVGDFYLENSRINHNVLNGAKIYMQYLAVKALYNELLVREELSVHLLSQYTALISILQMMKDVGDDRKNAFQEIYESKDWVKKAKLAAPIAEPESPGEGGTISSSKISCLDKL